MNKQLHLSNNLTVPAAIAARTVFIAGTKGSGKTYNAGVMAEEMLSAGVHVVILDPLGVWFGLRHDASGGPGGFPIVILGGEHADVPLLPTGGAAVADYVVRSGQSCILDMSGFAANAEQDRFVTDLLHRLFRLKATDKSAMHLIMDEADMFIPQQAISKTEIPLLGATKTIITKGRSRGLSMTLITQRPQSIAKSAIEEADVVLCHRMQGVNAVKAMKAWTDLYATAEQAKTFYDSLPQLDTGECWAWSPNFLKAFERTRFRPKATFDSSRTPDPGEVARKPKAAARVDLDKLTAEMKATADAVKATDPKALQAKVAELQRQLQTRPAVAPETKIVEKPVVTDAQVKEFKGIVAVLEREGNRRLKVSEEMTAGAKELAESGRQLVQQAQQFVAAMARAAGAPAPAASRAGVVNRSVRAVPPPKPAADAQGRDALTGPETKIIDAIAWLESIGVTEPEQTAVAFLAGYTYGGGGFNNPRGALRTKGHVEYLSGDKIKLTDQGRGVAKYPETELTNEKLHEKVLSVLPGPEQKILKPLLAAYPAPMSNEELAAASGYTNGAGGYNNPRGRLRTLGLIEYAKDGVRARAILFPEGEPATA